MLGESLHIASEYLTQEAKVASLASRMEVLEAKNSMLKMKLIESMHEVNTLKENSKTLADDLRAERQLTSEKDEQLDRKSTRLNSSHERRSRMPSSA